MQEEETTEEQDIVRGCYPCEVLVDDQVHTFAIVISYNLWENALATGQYNEEDLKYYDQQKNYTLLMMVGEQQTLSLTMPQRLDVVECPLSVIMPKEQKATRRTGRATFPNMDKGVKLVDADWQDTRTCFEQQICDLKHDRWEARKSTALQSGIGDKAIQASPQQAADVSEECTRVIALLVQKGLFPAPAKPKRKNMSFPLKHRKNLYDKWRHFRVIGGKRMRVFFQENEEFCGIAGVKDVTELKKAMESERKERAKIKREGK